MPTLMKAVVIDRANDFKLKDAMLPLPEVGAQDVLVRVEAAAINPALGLGTFLAQIFLRGPLIEAATREFHVDGSWAEPRVTRITGRDRSGAAKAEAKP